MNLKKITLAIASLTAAAAPAFGMESFNDRARVISARPVHERIPVAREECWNDVQRGYEERLHATGTGEVGRDDSRRDGGRRRW